MAIYTTILGGVQHDGCNLSPPRGSFEKCFQPKVMRTIFKKRTKKVAESQKNH